MTEANKDEKLKETVSKSNVEGFVMPKLLEDMAKKFVEGTAIEKEKLAKKLIDAGYNPDNVIIGERTWYDEDTYTMRYECFPISKDVNLEEA